MKLIKFIVILFAVFILSGCNGAQPTYNKDYSNEKFLVRDLFVKEEYQAKDLITQLNNSKNTLEAFKTMQQTYSIPVNGQPANFVRYYWTDSLSMIPQFGNKIFALTEGEYLQEALNTSWGFQLVYLERKLTKQQFHQLQVEQSEKTLERIALYEADYMKEYENIKKTLPEKKIVYIQPYNKKESCKIWFEYTEDNKWFEEDSYKIAWDGDCKDGYASGLGREIETSDMIDKWAITIYKQGKPTYYVVNDVLSNKLFEGVLKYNNDDIYGVYTIINYKANDIDITTSAGKRSNNNGPALISTTSPFWNGTYIYSKSYLNFNYKYTNYEQNDLIDKMDFQFLLQNKNGPHGWVISKQKNVNQTTGEFINKIFNPLILPKSYNEKADAIIREVHDAKEKAFEAQAEAQKVKKQYLKRICKDSIKVKFMDNDEYKAICSQKKEFALMQKINDKLNKISVEKIARLEKQKFNEQQQKEEQHRQELLSLERSRLSEIQRHNMTSELQEDKKRNQQGWKDLNDQINNMTPKTYNVNILHY